MSDVPSNTTTPEHNFKQRILPVEKRSPSPETCHEIPSKHFALEKSLEKEKFDSPVIQVVGNSKIFSDSVNKASSISKSDTGSANVTDVGETSVSKSISTSKVEANGEGLLKENSALNPSFEQGPTLEVKNYLLKIGIDYSSDSDLDYSPSPKTSSVNDKALSSNTQELPTKTDNRDDKDLELKRDVKFCEVSDENLYEDFNKSEEKPSIDKCLQEFSEQSLSIKRSPDSKPKSGGIDLVNFQLKPYTLPDNERFGSCRLITEFQKISIIGEGSFGVVYKVIDKRNDNVFALKKLKFKVNSQKGLPIQVMREISIMKTLNHPNIVNSHGVAVGSNFNNTYLILDFCVCDLSKIIDDDKSSAMLQEKEIKCIMLQLFEGLKYIHFNYVIHRDLSCLNVLFTSTGVLKIGDFGSSRNINPNMRMTPNVVSRWYRAPELLLGETMYTSAIDIWSSGCILAEIHLKKPLLKANSDMGMLAGIIDLLGTPTEKTWPGLSQLPVLQNFDLAEQPENKLRFSFQHMSPECFSLLEQLLLYDPKKRITAAEALRLPCFSTPPTVCGPEGLIPMLNVAEEIMGAGS